MVGADGNKSTLYALANQLPRAVGTATVHIPIFDRQVAGMTVTNDPITVLDRTTRWPVGVVAEGNEDRYERYVPM